MQELAGQRKGTKKYFHDGYFYHADPRYPCDLNAYICSYRYRQWQCEVTARANMNGVVFINGEHGHSRSCIQEYLRFEEFKNKLKQQARENVAAPNTILETLRIEYSDVSHLIQKTSAKMHIIRERNKYRPSLSENLKDLGNHLAKYEPARGIYQGQVVISETSSAVIFANDIMLERLNNCEEIYVDGTFKCVPKKIGAKQLFILHMRKMNVGMASVFVLCSNRTAELYEGIWKFLLERAPGLQKNLKFIMMDFERALIKSVRECMPWVTIRGCWFHYTRAISTHWQDLGLKNIPSLLVQDILALAWGLPLLPAKKFSVAINFYRQKADEVEPGYQKSVKQFIDYLENQWIRIADIVSLWNSAARTNNICESFHGRLSKRLGCHSNLYTFIEKLTRVIAEIESNWQNLERNGSSVGNKRLKQSAIDSYINYQQRLFSNGKLNVCEFLMRIKTRNIKNFIEFMLYSPHNVKNFGPEEIARPEELIELLGYSQTVGFLHHTDLEAPEVTSKNKPVVQESEVIQEPVPMPEDSEFLQEIRIIIDEEKNITEVVDIVKKPVSSPTENTSTVVVITEESMPPLQGPVIGQKKFVRSSRVPTAALKRAEKKNLRSRPTTEPAKFRRMANLSLEIISKKAKKGKKPRDQPIIEPEPRYKLAPFLKTALRKAEKKKKPHDQPAVEKEPRYKLAPCFEAALRKAEKKRKPHERPAVEKELRYKLSPPLRASLKKKEKKSHYTAK